MIRISIFMAVLMFGAPAAVAGCNPPGGLNMQQWMGICGQALQRDYMMGGGQGAPFPVFAQAMYQQYVQSGMRPQQAPVARTPVGMCVVGQTACFSGWFRQCEIRGTMPMWITGARRC